MRDRNVGMALLVAGAVGASGCAALLVSAGAAGGYAISRDSVTNHFDLSKERVFQESLQVVREMGYIEEQDATRGRLKARIHETNVTITVKPVSDKTVQLKVKARNLLLPKIEVAQEVYNKIFERLQ